ncbi:MAG: molybdenum cofactor biosynthesis protein MoeA [Candidatus Bathyarchaeota archaeon B23]|nr:MAG: molybdenum cofactor biosynthesis protein MoeA [Candidatus Bathyarchaeota archaeon B23]
MASVAPHPPTTLVDPYGREIETLRVAVTQRCDFHCLYCHREGESNPRRELTVGEIGGIAAAAVSLGIVRFKITGGEPLLREDLPDVVEAIASHAEEVSMTTNGSRLEGVAEVLVEAGLGRVNVSLPSLRREVFREITGVDALGRVKRGVEAALDAGLTPLKINVVMLKGLNSDEVPAFVEYSREVGATLQLIELQPLRRGATVWRRLHLDLKPLEEALEAEAVRVEKRREQGRKRYHLEDGAVVEVVRPTSNPGFCLHCHRLRLTSDGYLKPCLMRDDNLVDLLPLLGSGNPGGSMREAFLEAVRRRRPYWGVEGEG